MSKDREFGIGKSIGFDDERQRPSRRERSAGYKKTADHESAEPSASHRFRALRSAAAAESWDGEDWEDDDSDEDDEDAWALANLVDDSETDDEY